MVLELDTGKHIPRWSVGSHLFLSTGVLSLQMHESRGHVVLVDGECVVCDGFAQFVAARDPQQLFFFETQQSNSGLQLLKDFQQPQDLSTIVLIEKGPKGEQCFMKSTAVLHVMEKLKFPWSLLSVFLLVPEGLRDWAYGVFARNRYRLFGRKDSCSLPSKVVRDQLSRKLDEQRQ